MGEPRMTGAPRASTHLLDVWVETPTAGGAASLHDALSRAAIASVVRLPCSVHVPARRNTPFGRAEVLEVIGEWWRDAGTPDVRIEERGSRRRSPVLLVQRVLADSRTVLRRAPAGR